MNTIEINPNVKDCLRKYPNSMSILQNIDISNHYTPIINWIRKDSGLIYTIPEIKSQSYLALFDIDWTVTYAQKKMLNWDSDDIHIIPGRLETIANVFKKGYTKNILY